MLRFAALVCIAAAAVRGLANDGWMVSTGDGYQFGKSNPNIQMVSEDLRITMRDNGADVDVQYRFKNHGPSAKVYLGFPEHRGNVEEPAIDRFRTWVDGRRVGAERKGLSANREDRMYQAAWIKQVNFGRAATRRVRIKYSIRYSGDTSMNNGLYYILVTAKTWKMPIKDFKITVDWTRMNSLSKPVFTLPGALWAWKPTGWRERTATLKNFVPRGDLSLTMRDGFWNFMVNGKHLKPPRGIDEWVLGPGRDPYLPVKQARLLFTEDLKIDSKGVHLRDGRARRLAIRNRRVAGWRDRVECVSLRELVRALGGKFRFNAREDRVELTIPKAYLRDSAAG